MIPSLVAIPSRAAVSAVMPISMLAMTLPLVAKDLIGSSAEAPSKTFRPSWPSWPLWPRLGGSGASGGLFRKRVPQLAGALIGRLPFQQLFREP